jgi:hypothetical protein
MVSDVSNEYGVHTYTDQVCTDRCPPSFNCLLPAFTCGSMEIVIPTMDSANVRPVGEVLIVSSHVCAFILSDCWISHHLDKGRDSLADGGQRRLREEGKPCQCKDGWGGINCNGKYQPL